ncbi:MAG: hypothetical protein EOO06_04615 [Chitinophagaceae bacterium]|nr:MAG: hypothetical protein EOO06_04615 [Chitinophagaceae bacterium]
MKRIASLVILCSCLMLASCSKKSVPNKEEAAAEAKAAATAAEAAKKPVVRAPVKTPTPKAIVVNDIAAKKTTDGRYYYDLEGKRYWRSKKDGKYYLYYKGMFDNKDFQ